MLDALKTLFENDVVSAEVRQEIEEAWNTKVKENRQAVTAELREEFAQKYEHDKSVMVEAIDKMLGEKLAEEIAEFQEDRKQLAETKAKYAVKMRENADLLKGFVVDRLSKEVGELHEDQKQIATKFKMLEDFVVESLAKEIAEFNEDKKDLAETKVRLVREAKIHMNKIRTKFVETSAEKVSQIVDKVLNKEIGQLKEDIESARKNDFGRKLFEAFANEYANSYLNEKSETSKLLKVVKLKDQQLAEAKKISEKTKLIVEAKEAEVRKVTDAANRTNTINELTGPLSKDQKEIMIDLLESVQTAKLRSAFDKYLPAVIDGKTPEKKAILKEGKEVTGNREEKTNVSDNASDNVVELRKLAGLN
tara:strand:+ start:642 stop:1733 length:1092 start_codon:yes stop_codon:yes gene_type:complete